MSLAWRQELFYKCAQHITEQGVPFLTHRIGAFNLPNKVHSSRRRV